MPQEASGAPAPQTKELVGPPPPPTLDETLNQIQTLNTDLTGTLKGHLLMLDRRVSDHSERLYAEAKTRAEVDQQVLRSLEAASGLNNTVVALTGVSLIANLVLAVAVVRLYQRLKKYGWR